MWIRHVRRGIICNFKLIRVNFTEKMTFIQKFKGEKHVTI